MFHRCVVVLIVAVAVTVSSFAPSKTSTRRLDRVDRHRNTPNHRMLSLSMSALPDSRRATKIEETESSQRRIIIIGHEKEQPKISLPAISRAVASLIVGSFLFLSPDPAAAITTMIAPNVLQPPASTAEPNTIRTASIATSTFKSSSTMSDSFLTISDYPQFTPISELRIQPKYLDLAGELKEELKFRAQQAKEKATEEAAKVQEKQQAAADERAAKLKEYDDMFDQSEKERNEYYSQRIISRDTYLQKLRDDESKEDRSEYNKMMTALSPEATPVEELKYKLERQLEEENRLRTALLANKQKDQDDRDTKVERTLLKVSIEKSEVQTSKLRKSIDLEESLETIRLQRQAEVRVYQERSEAREKEKQEKIDQIRLAKIREREAFQEQLIRKKEELEELKFNNAQIMFDRKFEDLDRFEQRKGILAAQEKKEDAARTNAARKESNRLAAEGAAAATNAEGQQPPPPQLPNP